jgi:hypothetical protein
MQCPACGKAFAAARSTAKFCSARCRVRSNRHPTWRPLSVTEAPKTVETNVGATTLAPRRKRRISPKIAKENQRPIMAKTALSVTASIPRMNCAPRHVLDAEFGFTRKLAPAPARVLAEINRQTKELNVIEAFRRKQRSAA